ncbi:hypothetical protein GCM10007919_53310 [Rhizobium indigoferae]|nr:hypothetical protein GCM10007919_53310 [Rhizobium indigoferae]
MGVFVLLLGFPGVGKLTIAKELGSLLSAKIIDNHWFNNPILRLLDEDQTAPLPEGVWEYTGRVRQAVLDASPPIAARRRISSSPMPVSKAMSGAHGRTNSSLMPPDSAPRSSFR